MRKCFLLKKLAILSNYSIATKWINLYFKSYKSHEQSGRLAVFLKTLQISLKFPLHENITEDCHLRRYFSFKKEMFIISKYAEGSPRKYACINLSSLACVAYQSILWTFEKKGVSLRWKKEVEECLYVYMLVIEKQNDIQRTYKDNTLFSTYLKPLLLSEL